MNLAEDPTLPDLLKSPLWLEIRFEQTTWLFELKAGEERAVAVGSQPRADVHIERPGVASMHFHFEREGDAVIAIPGYRADLRINSMQALEPRQIGAHAIVDFCGASLEVTTHRQRPAHVDNTVNADRPSGLDYLQSLPEDTDPTGVAVTAVPARIPPSQDTLQVARACFVTERIVRDAAIDRDQALFSEPKVAAPVPGTALGPQGTVIMSRADLRVHDAAPAELAPGPWNTERIPVAATFSEPTGGRAATPDATPTRIETPAARRSKPPGPGALPPPAEAPLSPVPNQPVVLAAQASASQQTTDFDVASVAPFFVTPPSGLVNRAAQASPTAAPETTPPASVRAASASTAPVSRTVPQASTMPRALLTALGTAARRSPWLVSAGALSGAIILTLALIGASRLAPGKRSHRLAGAPGVASASARVATPLSTPLATTTTPIAPASPTMAIPGVMATPSSEAAGTVPSSANADPEVALAVGHLVAGRLADAQLAYSRLAARDPQNAAYAAISRMLHRRTTAGCGQKQPAQGCPEVRP